MIASLQGTLRDREVQRDNSAVIIVDVNGVGYELSISARLAHRLPVAPSAIDLAVYTHVREGAITLYGFGDRSERNLFTLLISAHGVGPAMALAILGCLSESELVHAVRSGDIKALTAVSGVGTKTAQRLILELAQRLDGVGEPLEVGAQPDSSANDVRNELREALGSLGYGTDEIRSVVQELRNSGSVEELLREALSQLAPRR